MNVHVYKYPKQASEAAALLLAAQVIRKPDSVLGLATGSTPIDTYQKLIEFHRAGILDFSRAMSFNLDEYVGLKPEHPASYRHFMDDQLFKHINMKATYVPRGTVIDLVEEGLQYDRDIMAAGGIDVQLLGIGNNGHIGFNEPAEYFGYHTQVVDLTRSTIQANRRFFESEDEVPRQAISMGIGSIMQAREILLVAFGKHKAEAIRRALKDEVDPMCPASILQLHPKVTVLLDEEAASLL